MRLLLLCTFPLLAACAPTDPLVAMRADIKDLEARSEHKEPGIEVQHVLIAFQGADRATVTRTKEEAEKLAAEVLARARAGEDFKALMKECSNDPGPGTYPMTKATRGGMVAGFGNVGWRLQVNQLGVAPYEPKVSPFGWHVIKRIK